MSFLDRLFCTMFEYLPRFSLLLLHSHLVLFFRALKDLKVLKDPPVLQDLKERRLFAKSELSIIIDFYLLLIFFIDLTTHYILNRECANYCSLLCFEI